MKDQQQKHDEIDVFDLFRYIGRGFTKLSNIFLRFINFLIKNAVILLVLIVVGVVAGYFVEKSTPDKYKTEVFVTATFESAEYLYKTIEEMDAKIEEKDSSFLKIIGLSVKKPGIYSLEITPIPTSGWIEEERENYFELLQDQDIISQEQLKMIILKGYNKHKITLVHNQKINAESVLNTLLKRLRKNTFYSEITQQMYQSLERQIESNKFLIAQIDSLIKNYSTRVGDKTSEALVYSETSLNLGGLLSSRIEMLRETRVLQRKKTRNASFLRTVNMGSPQKLEKLSISETPIIFFPILLLAAFFLFHILKWVFSRAKSLE